MDKERLIGLTQLTEEQIHQQESLIELYLLLSDTRQAN